MRDKILIRLASWAVNRTARVMSMVVVLTIILGFLAGRIGITLKWSDMLPASDQRTLEFDRILEEFVSASNIVIVVQGPEERIKAFADALAPRLLEPLPVPGSEGEERVYVRRVDYKRELDFIRQHGFMLIKEADLKNLQDIFQDPDLVPLLYNINESFEKEYIEAEASLSTREKEDGAFVFLDGIENWLTVLERYLAGEEVALVEARAAVDQLLIGEPYFISYDRRALILNAIPTFSMMDVDLMVQGTDAVQALVDETLKAYPGVRAGLTGIIPLGRDEMVYGMEGLEYTSTIALIAIGVLLVVSFRMWAAPLLALFNLVVGLIWAAGLVSLLVPVLNIMTAMFVVILLGLGIDFSIHIIASFTEMRARGLPLEEALREGLLKSGKGVMTGAVTTACAFLALMIGDSRAMSEMGLVTGIGLLAVAAAAFTFLPTVLILRERRREKQLLKKGITRPPEPRDISFRFLGRTGAVLKSHYVFTTLGAIVVTALLTWSALQITFDYNYMNLEPEGIPSVTLQDTVLDKFDLSMDFAYLVAESVEESRRLAKVARDYPSVALVEDISLYLPSPEEQVRRKPHIKAIRQALDRAETSPLKTGDLKTFQAELARLEANIIELQDLSVLGGHDKVYLKSGLLVGVVPELEDASLVRLQRRLAEEMPLITRGSLTRLQERLDQLLDSAAGSVLTRLNTFQQATSDYFRTSVLEMTNLDPITLDNLPTSIVDQYGNRDRSLFLVTVLPGDNIWQDAKFLYRFTDDLAEMSERATGFPPVFRALITIIARDGRNAAYLTLLVVFGLLWIDFRQPGHALMAMIPLGAGMLWMVGIMQLVGRQLDAINVMAIPLIIGIGIDDGVHIIHRWRREGYASVRTVFASTGKAILLTSLTTMLAYGSLVFSLYRGYGSLGLALFIGVGTCFLTTTLILPGIIGWVERRK